MKSPRRADPIALPSDSEAARALVLQYIASGDASTVERSAALEAMNHRIALLRSGDGRPVEAELLSHAAICDALFVRFAATAVDCQSAEHRLKYLKAAMQAQAAYTRCIASVAQLGAMRLRAAALDA